MEIEPKEMAPPPNITSSEPWHFNIGSPGWIAALSGTVGLQGVNSHVDLGFDQLIRHVVGLMSVSAEARKGRFGVYGDLLYMGLEAAVYPEGMVSKANLVSDQYLIDGEVYYRVLEGPRGWLDLRAGARYNDLYSSLKLFGNSVLIDQAATDFVNAANDDLRGLLERLLKGVLNPGGSPLPIPPLGFEEKAKLLKLIIAARQDPITAQAKIAQVLNRELNRTFSLTERWVDPYIGIGGRYNLTKAFYLTGKVDVVAGVRQHLVANAGKLPGSRVLEGRFMAIQQAVGIPKGRSAGAKYLRGFIEDVKASGLVAQAIERSGIRGVSVAPPAPGGP